MNMERKTGLMNKKYVSPCFLPGMRLGNIMFTLAAACAHARTVGVECRVPWAYNDASLMLRSRLGGWVLPSTPCGTNEPPSGRAGFAATSRAHGILKGRKRSSGRFSRLSPRRRNPAPLAFTSGLGTTGASVTSTAFWTLVSCGGPQGIYHPGRTVWCCSAMSRTRRRRCLRACRHSDALRWKSTAALRANPSAA